MSIWRDMTDPFPDTDADAMRAEIHALRRELAARRAVDGWLCGGGFCRCVGYASGNIRAYDLDAAYVLRWSVIAEAPDYPALATALGLDWEPKETTCDRP